MNEETSFWQDRWNQGYVYPNSNARLALREMEEIGFVRSAVLDVGCGPRSLSSQLKDAGYRIVGLDRGLSSESRREGIWNRTLLLPSDVHRFVSPSAEEQALLVKMATFMNPWSGKIDISHGFVDFLILGNVLNYLHYQAVLAASSEWLKPGALVFVHNEIDLGDREFFSLDRPRSNAELVGFIESLGLKLKRDLFEPKRLEPNELLAVFERPVKPSVRNT